MDAATGSTGGPNDEGFAVVAPQVSLPKGGGAVRGIGEKFSANPVTGSGSLSVPIATSPGRAGFGPQLALTYDSGAGHGPFGLGWALAIPSIKRKTDKGLPQYRDALESDGFLLAGAEDLVPVLDPATGRRSLLPAARVGSKSYRIDRYVPRIEGLFARIERWTEEADPANCFWRTISRDNLTCWYGRSGDSRITDPDNPRQTFEWRLCETYDDKGNAALYRYLPEDSRNVEPVPARGPAFAQRYLQSIRYGNVQPYLPNLTAQAAWPDADWVSGQSWMFEVLFDYGQCAADLPSPADDLAWPARLDPLSDYRAGFEIRTNRLCRRVLMLHHFAELGRADYLVRATVFGYREPTTLADPATPGYTVLASVSQWSYQWDADNATYRSRQRPPLEFTYSEPRVDPIPRTLDPAQLENLPVGTQGAGYRWIDLDGEGLSGVLCEQRGAWYYKSGLGDGTFGPTRVLALRPTMAELPVRHEFLDLAGAGRIDLVDFGGPTPGYHRRQRDGWTRHMPFDSLPQIDWADPNLRFVDLTGDGIADVLITSDDVLTWYPSCEERGFGAAQATRPAFDEDTGPHWVAADAAGSIFLADMSGDGLSDLVRIRNGEACYWPNLGYGRFGAKVTFDNSPCFDHPDAYDSRRLRLADIDGSGPVDVVYLGRRGAQLYFNRSGNSLSDPLIVPLPLATVDLAAVQLADLKGSGTACLVWNSSLPGAARAPVWYVDLMADGKPHLLTGIDNNLGGTSRIEYTPSTRFYIADRLAGTPWITRLPFPVQCVSKVTVQDQWRGTAFSTRYSYHHGYFDGVEREFRGFGRVDQVDVESFGAASASNAGSPWVTADHTLYQPPIRTITWYHTGAPLEGRDILGQLDSEYFSARYAQRLPNWTSDRSAFREKPLPDPELPRDLCAAEWREALRACKGLALRQEVYELDVADLQTPVRLFSAAQHNCTIQRLQPRAGNRYGVFLVTDSEVLTYHYELDLAGSSTLEPDPRITHTLNLEVDTFGHVLESALVVYPRRGVYADPALTSDQLATIRRVQSESSFTLSTTRYTADWVTADAYRLAVPCQSQTWNVCGIEPAGGYFSLAELKLRDPAHGGTTEIAYQALPDGTPQRRPVECARTLFYTDDLTATLPLGQHGLRGLTRETYKLALTQDLLTAVFTDVAQSSAALAALAQPGSNGRRISGYGRGDELFPGEPVTLSPLAQQWWMDSGVAGFAPDAAAHFYLPTAYTDAFGHVTTLQYGNYDLFIASTEDAMGNIASVQTFDYRVLAPTEMVDANGNHTQAALDILGNVIATATKGKPLAGGLWQGDDLDHFTHGTAALDLCNPSPTLIQAFCSNTVADRAQARLWRDRATSRFVYHFGETRDALGNVASWGDRPAGACSIQRERHQPEVDADPNSDLEAKDPIQISLDFSDGTGAVLMRKVQAEPAATGGPLRYLVNGLTVVNNKGKPVKQYEPAFSADFGFETPAANGVSTTTYYDAPGRMVRVDLPDGTFRRVEFSPWRSLSFDANDTVRDSQWYVERGAPDPAAPLPANADGDQRAAWLAAQHAATPAESHFDSRGRDVVDIAHNRVPSASGAWQDERHLTYTRLDAEGRPLWIRDSRGNLMMQYVRRDPPDPATGLTINQVEPDTFTPGYDLAGNLLFQHGMDAGDRGMLPDAAGKPLLAWDANDYPGAAGGAGAGGSGAVAEQRLFRTEYDALHRPSATWLTIGGVAALIEAFEYCDTHQPNGATGLADAQARNLIGRAVEHWDPSGLATLEAVDLSAQPARITRTLAKVPAAAPAADPALLDWNVGLRADLLESETFAHSTQHDALGRAVRVFNWHRGTGSRVAVVESQYNARGLLASQLLVVRALKTDTGIGYTEPAAATRTAAIAAITYNEKGQKQSLALGNGTTTRYTYDTDTYRLIHLYTQRGAAFTTDCGSNTSGNARPGRPCGVQNLHYTYDPVGNVMHIQDDAQDAVYFSGQFVEPSNDYTYDALYRLIEATGRENAAAVAPPPARETPWPTGAFAAADALRNYTQRYTYDSAGNFIDLSHVPAVGNGWTRHYTTKVDSNRLDRTWIGTDTAAAVTYYHDPHGNLLNLNAVAPPDPANAWGLDLVWDWRDMIQRLDLGGGGVARYAYGMDKERTRKHITRTGGIVEDRLYLPGYELYRRRDGAGNVVEEIDTLHLFESTQRTLIVDDVLSTDSTRPDGLTVRSQTLFRYQYGNLLGSVSLELDDAAAVISYEEYQPYGAPAYRLMAAAAEAPPKRYRYTGMERDEESGLGYHGARYLAPHLGRWVSADPIGLKGGHNAYGYVDARPIGVADRSGEAGLTPMEQGVAWGKEVISMVSAKYPVVAEVTVYAKIDGKIVTSRLDGLIKTADGWVALENKLSSTTDLTEPQKKLLAHIAKGGDFRIAAAKPEKIAQLNGVLHLSPGAKLTAHDYKILHQGNASQVLSDLKVIGADQRALLLKSGRLLTVPEKDANLIMEIARGAKNPIELEKAVELFKSLDVKGIAALLKQNRALREGIVEGAEAAEGAAKAPAAATKAATAAEAAPHVTSGNRLQEYGQVHEMAATGAAENSSLLLHPLDYLFGTSGKSLSGGEPAQKATGLPTPASVPAPVAPAQTIQESLARQHQQDILDQAKAAGAY